MMQKSIKVGLVGYGYWGQVIARNVLLSTDFKLTHVFDISDQGRSRIESNLNSAVICSSWSELLESNVELIVIATPVSSHFELCKQALLASKHILVTKPMTDTVEQSAELLSLASKQARYLAVDHTYLFSPAIKAIKDILDLEDLGRILYFDSVRISLGKYQSDTNVVADLASHDFAIIDYLFPKKWEVQSCFVADHFKTGRADQAYIGLRDEDGILAHIHVNWLAPNKERKIVIVGDEKMLIWDDLNQSEKIKIYDKKVRLPKAELERKASAEYRIGDMRSPSIDANEPVAVELSHLAAAIRGELTLINCGALGTRVVRMVEHCNSLINIYNE